MPHRHCLNVRCHSIVITVAVLALCVSVMKDGGQGQTTCPRKSCDSFTTGATRRLRAQSTPTKELLCMRYPLILNSCCIYQQFWHISEANGSSSAAVLTHKPRLHTASTKEALPAGSTVIAATFYLLCISLLKINWYESDWSDFSLSKVPLVKSKFVGH